MRCAATLVVIAGPVALTACGPLPLAEAERVCLEDARDATGPRGAIGLGIGSDGDGSYSFGRAEISVSSDYILGRDPDQVYTNCVQRRSGQPPSRPLNEQPGWSGRE